MSKLNFVKSVCASAGVNVVRIRHPKAKGRYGFTRVMQDGSLERSSKTYDDDRAAFMAAHKHYNLRSA